MKFIEQASSNTFYPFQNKHQIHGFIWAYHSVAAGSNPKHTIYAYFNLYYWNCNQKS